MPYRQSLNQLRAAFVSKELAYKLLLTLIRRMPCLVISWQSYSSKRTKALHERRCSSEASVINGQLSSSNTLSFSFAARLWLRWYIPSSVMSSQWDRLCNDRNTRYQGLPVLDQLNWICLYRNPVILRVTGEYVHHFGENLSEHIQAINRMIAIKFDVKTHETNIKII